MPIRQLDANNLGHDEDWEGNNAAFKCPVCGKVYLVNSTRMHHEVRDCPNCHKSTARCTRGRLSGGSASIEWQELCGSCVTETRSRHSRVESTTEGGSYG